MNQIWTHRRFLSGQDSEESTAYLDVLPDESYLMCIQPKTAGLGLPQSYRTHQPTEDSTQYTYASFQLSASAPSLSLGLVRGHRL